MIEIKNLEKDFDKENKIKFKDFVFEDGKTYVITGPSGCGKSTLLNLISGIISATNGNISIKFSDKDFFIEQMSQKEKDKFRFNNIGYIFQDYKLIDDFSVLDNMQMLNINKRIYSTEEIKNALTLTHIEKKAKQKVKNLSGGEKQRVAIARAIIKKSNIILADEPTESLNEDLSHEIIELLTSVAKKEKKTLLMVTHDTSLVKYFDKHIELSDFLVKGDESNV